MEATRKERIILYGAVPIVAALVGAVATVVAGRIFDAGDAADAIKAVVMDPKLNAVAKSKLIELINANDQQFYDLIRSIFSSSLTILFLLVGAGVISRRS